MFSVIPLSSRRTWSVHRAGTRMKCDQKAEVTVDRPRIKDRRLLHYGRIHSPKMADRVVTPRALGAKQYRNSAVVSENRGEAEGHFKSPRTVVCQSVNNNHISGRILCFDSFLAFQIWSIDWYCLPLYWHVHLRHLHSTEPSILFLRPICLFSFRRLKIHRRNLHFSRAL